RASMQRQNQAAQDYGYSFLKTSQAVHQFVDAGYLVRVPATPVIELHNVSYPFARPAVKLFLERLATQYFAACGEKLTVTSLTRPIDKQPANASEASVHPTGMALDLRIPRVGKCRSWLESTLLSLEKTGVLDVTRERYPPHYHVALFTKPYEAYVASMTGESSEYMVRRGDSLYTIARRTGLSIPQLKAANGLRGDLIHTGQVLKIPGSQELEQIASAPQPAAEPTVPTLVAVHYDEAPELVPASNAPEPIEHQVRRGETLWRIARLYGTSVSHLQEENELRDNLLQVGQVLRVSILTASNP
ncbi:MAG TPA: LysM peptidoglycan-binding domain-containing protein, partial [Pseudomonadaceae bacterium]|nr:LysM peptidoglycan-binding domain-containing protein [Pseudomonadaceae bacterium]